MGIVLYLGKLAIATGTALIRGSLKLLVAIFVCWVLLHWIEVPWEERTLRQRLGEANQRYEGQVPQWISPITPALTPRQAYIPRNVIHIVAEGETLESIAVQYGISVADIRTSNAMIGDAILVGQRLMIPVKGSPEPINWRVSTLRGDLAAAYPLTFKTKRFTLHYTPDSYPARDPGASVHLITQALNHLENLMQSRLDDNFDVYVAGSLFAPPYQSLRGRSFASQRRMFVLHDGTGDAADQRYIAAHELTHLYIWKVFGPAVWSNLSEGAAVYAGMAWIDDSDHLPVRTFCAAYLRVGKLPRVSVSLDFISHIYNLENYYTAGCFVEYLIEKYGVQRFARLYSSGDFKGLYGRSIVQLEEEWRAYLATIDLPDNLDPAKLVASVKALREAYQELFPIFRLTEAKIAAYRELDEARMALLKGRLDQMEQHLVIFREATQTP